MTPRFRPAEPGGTHTDEPTSDIGSGGSDARALSAELESLQQQRRQHEREAEQLRQLLRGIALVRRDRDAGVSQPLRAHRAHLEHVWASAEELITASLRVAVRLELLDGDDSDPIVRRARRALRQGKDALQALSGGLGAET